MNAQKFYSYVITRLNNIASLYGITKLDRYYSITDLKFSEINDLFEINQVYAQFILHSQNATIISNIVNFFENYSILKKITCDFNPSGFLDHYNFKNES